MRFWLEERALGGGWFYSVEMRGVTNQFTKLEYLEELRDRLAGSRGKAVKELVVRPIAAYLRGRAAVNGKFRALRHGPREAYIFLRYQKAIAEFLSEACTRFGGMERPR